jgi:hypothetical protein
MARYSYEYDKDNGVSTCIITNKQGKVFVGIAECHPDDADMKSEYTGSAIAEMRAEKAALQDMRDNEIIPELRALRELYGTMKHSTRFNPKSYENIMLQKLIRQKEAELADIRLLVAQQNQAIKEFIFEKEKCYQGIRRNRAVAAQEQGQKEIK